MRVLLLCLAALIACALLPPAPSRAADMPVSRIAVFGQEGFPGNNVGVLETPDRIVDDLHELGLQADLLDAAALADPGKFSASKYAAVIIPTGNGYPLESYENLKRFHEAGGSLITTGIPFTHAYTRRNNSDGTVGWHDEGHKDETAQWGPNGIGIGGFAGTGDADQAPLFLPVFGDPLHLGATLLKVVHSTPRQGVQWLDPTTVPASVTVIPAVGEHDRPLVALLIHNSDQFKGAVDAWVYRAPAGDIQDWATRQMLLRATLAVLSRRNVLDNAGFQNRLAQLDESTAPSVYANLTLPTVPKAYSTFQPKMPPPARHLFVADMRKLGFDERRLMVSLQGIVNRKQPRIYLIFGDDEQFWLDELQRQGETDAPVAVNDPLSLVETFKDEYKGAVIPDPKVYLSPCVAESLAGADDLVVASPELASKLHIKIKADLRGKFHDDADALRYLRTDVLPRLDPYLACCLDPNMYGEGGALDSIIAARGAVFWITGPNVQGKLPGTNETAELNEMRALFASMPLGAVVRGFWWHGDGTGLQESDGVHLGSRFGKITLVSDLINNLSVHSGVKADSLKQKPRAPAPPLDRSKVYICFTMSDGDNLCTWAGYFRKYFDDPVRGTIPVGWGMGPSLIDLAPDWARWYYNKATPNDEFLCDVSGVAYMYPSSWGRALADPEAAFRYYYSQTRDYMKRMDMKTVRLMDVSSSDIAHVAPLLQPGVDFLMPDYGFADANSYDALTYTLPGGQVIFRAATNGKGPENFADQIRKRAGANRPSFLNVFVWNWGSSLSDLKKTLEILGPDYVAVTPSQLNTLSREAGMGKPQVQQAAR